MRGSRRRPHTWVEWSASQLLQNTPLHPIAEWGRLRFGADAPAEQRLADLEGTLRLIGLDPTEHAPLLAPLVDIPLPPSRAANFSPEELATPATGGNDRLGSGGSAVPARRASRSRTYTGPTRLRSISCARWPSAGRRRSLLIIATTRPEFRPPWSVRSHHSVISLSPLDRVQVAKMVANSRPVMRCRGTLSKGSASAPAASRCSSRRLRASYWSAASRAARKRFRRPCSSRSPRGSIGSAPRVRSRRSAQC